MKKYTAIVYDIDTVYTWRGAVTYICEFTEL